MKPAYIPFLLTLALGLSIASCKKDPEEPGSCRLASARIKIKATGYDATTALTYDSTGRIVSTLVSGTASKVRTFTYKGDTTIIRETNGTTLKDFKVVRNNNGNIRDLYVYAINSSTLEVYVHYDYNNSGKVFSQTTTYYPGGTSVSTTSYNAAGDAATSKNPASTSAGFMYEYFTDQAFQNGDPRAISNYIDYGAHAVTNAHLIRKVSSQNSAGGTITTDYTYTYGAGGNISTVTEKSGSVENVYDYTYNCK